MKANSPRAMASNLLLTGAGGMLGRTLVGRLGAGLAATYAHDRLDIADASAVAAVLDAVRPRVVINCAACTAVDACESDPDRAFRANAIGAGVLAAACGRRGIRLVHLSTDYVFCGDLDRPYHEWDATGPRTVYGASKLAGEQAVRAHCPDHLIVRTAWLYGPGGPSFLHSILRLAADASAAPLPVVDDQRGSPTSTAVVADLLVHLIAGDITGTVHASCEGETTWYGFATAIAACRRLPRALRPCSTAEHPRPAPRPANSRLEKRALRLHGLPALADWRQALEHFLEGHPDG